MFPVMIGQRHGAFAFGGLEEQAARLEREGVEVVEETVDLWKYQWGRRIL